LPVLLFHKPLWGLEPVHAEPGIPGQLAALHDVPRVYAAGRLDADSEGLLLATPAPAPQQRLTDPAGPLAPLCGSDEGTVTPEPSAQLREWDDRAGGSHLPASRLLADPRRC